MTDETSRLAEIRAPLEEWYRAAVSLLANNPETRVQQIPAGLEEWHQVQPRFYLLGRQPFFIYTPETVSALQDLDAFANLERVARQSSGIGPLFGGQIGSSLVTHEFNFWDFACAALPRPEDVSNGSIVPFEDIYLNLSRQFPEMAAYETISLLQGITFEHTPFELAPDVTIETLTDDEIKQVLKFGLIPSPFAERKTAFYVDDWSVFALKKRWQYPLRWGGLEVPKAAEDFRDMADATDNTERLLQCVGLLTKDPVFVSGILTLQDGQSFGVPKGDGVLFQALPAPRLISGTFFDSAKCAELREIWAITQDGSSAQIKAFSLALRRLSHALQRSRTDDRLLDICIAAEAFYLTDLGKPKDKGEMRYRLSLRAAVWSDGTMPGWTRLEIFQQIRAGYDVRSAVAHGGLPDKRDLRIKGKPVPLEEYASFVQCIEDIVRAGLYKAFRHFIDTGHPRNIDWDALVLTDNPISNQDDLTDTD